MRDIEFVNILNVDDKMKEKVRQWRNQARVRKAMLNQHIIPKKEHLGWLDNLRGRNDWKFWIVFVDNIPIGSAYLQNIKYEELISEWGFYIGEDTYIDKGLGKCILFKLLEIFFDEMEFKTLFTKILSDNIVALNLYGKFKFKEIDRLSNKAEDEITLLEFCKEDWMKFKEKLRNECYRGNGK